VTEVPQIRYVCWGSESPEHAWYWSAVACMADLIGMALQSHGINVVQTKEKFGDARVYIEAREDEDVPLSRIEDRRAYREVYMTALGAAPMLRSAILDGSSYPSLASGEQAPEDWT